MANDPFVVTIPVRGIVVDNPDLTLEGVFSKPWTLVGPDQYGLLAAARGRNDSVEGNIKKIVKRLSPSSLLLVRYFPGQRTSVWDEQRAMQVLAALNMALLLTDISGLPGTEARPRPLFRARYPEYCDLPLSFDEQGVKSVGHTSRLGLLSSDNLPRLNFDEILTTVDSAPSVVTNVLQNQGLDNRESGLAEGMLNILSAFDTLTRGAFVSRLVSASEQLLDTQAGTSQGGVQWKRLENRLRTAVPYSVVPNLIQIRHDYTHAGLQPETDRPTFKALAMAVECWGVMQNLYSRIPDRGDVETVLDCASKAEDISQEIEPLANVESLVESGPSDSVEWIQAYLEGDAT